VIYFNVHDFGALGDGVTNDTLAINLAIEAAYLNGGGTVVFEPKSYVIKRRVSTSQAGSILVKNGVSLQGNNTTLLLRDNCGFVSISSVLGATTTITNDVVLGSTTLNVSDSSIFSIGNNVSIRCGNNAWDANETSYYLQAKVIGINSKIVIVIDRPINTAMAISATAIKNRSVTVINELLENISISGFNLINDLSAGTNAESGIDLGHARNIQINNITAENPGAGVILCRYSDTVSINNINCKKSVAQNGQGSKGRVFNLWNSVNVHVDSVVAENFEGNFAFIESYNKSTRFTNIHITNNSFIRKNSTLALFFVGQSSETNIDNLTIDGNFCMLSDAGGTTGNVFDATNMTIDLNTASKCIKLNQINGDFTYNRIRYLEKTYSVTIPILTNMNMAKTFFPKGYYKSLSVFISSVTGMLLGTSYLSKLISNTNVLVNGSIYGIGSMGTDYVYNIPSAERYFVLNTDGNVPDNSYAVINIEYYS
jgi:hypothetical protein